MARDSLESAINDFTARQLRMQLGDSLLQQKIEKEQRPSPFASPERWKGAREAYDSGWRPREIRLPVHIDPYGPVSSPEKLQELIGLPSVPECLSTTIAPNKEQLNSTDPGPRQAQICHINLDEEEVLDNVADYDLFKEMVFFQGVERYVVQVKRIKGESDEQQQQQPEVEEEEETGDWQVDKFPMDPWMADEDAKRMK